MRREVDLPQETDVTEPPAAPAEDRRGLRARTWWVAVAIVTAVQLLMRWWAVLGLDSVQDDVDVTYRVLDRPLDLSYLTYTQNGHWGPVVRVVEWLAIRADPFNPGVQFGVVLALLVLADLSLLVLVRRLFGTRLTGLGVYVVWAVTPVLAVAIGSWSLGLLLLPLVIGMVWATYAHVAAMRSGGWRIPVAGAAVLATLLVSPQAAVVVPFLLLLTLLLPTLGAEARAEVAPRIRLGLVYAAVGTGYLLLYLMARADRSTRPMTPASLADGGLGLMLQTAFPSLVGGPWSSGEGSLPNVGALSGLALSGVLQLVALIALVSLVIRRWAWRAWLILLVLMVAQTVVVTVAVRSDLMGPEVMRQTRYLVPLLVPALVLLGSAFDHGPMRPWCAGVLASRRGGMLAAGAAILVLLVFAESAWITNYRVAESMKASSSATFWANVREALKETSGQAVVDRALPNEVVWSAFTNISRASQALRYFARGQRWGAPDPELRVLTNDGRIVVATIEPFAFNQEGPLANCGYGIVGTDWVTIPMSRSDLGLDWGVQLNYLASGDSELEVETVDLDVSGSAGQNPVRFEVAKGPGRMRWTAPGVIDAVRVRLAREGEPGVCVDRVIVGGVVSGG